MRRQPASAGPPRSGCRARPLLHVLPGRPAYIAATPRSRNSFQPAPRALGFGLAVTNSFDVGVGADDRADVAAVQHRAAALRRMREIALESEQRCAHRRDRGDHEAACRRASARSRGSASRPGVEAQCAAASAAAAGRRGRRPHPSTASADGAVEQAGVEMGEAEVLRPDGAPACPCRDAAGPSIATTSGAS